MFKMKSFFAILVLAGSMSFPASSSAGGYFIEDVVVVAPAPGLTYQAGCCANIRQAPSSTIGPAPCRTACVSTACPARRSPRRFPAHTFPEFIRSNNPRWPMSWTSPAITPTAGTAPAIIVAGSLGIVDMAGAGVIGPAPATPPGSGERAIMEADVSRPDQIGAAAKPDRHPKSSRAPAAKIES